MSPPAVATAGQVEEEVNGGRSSLASPISTSDIALEARVASGRRSAERTFRPKRFGVLLGAELGLRIGGPSLGFDPVDVFACDVVLLKQFLE